MMVTSNQSSSVLCQIQNVSGTFLTYLNEADKANHIQPMPDMSLVETVNKENKKLFIRLIWMKPMNCIICNLWL